MKKTAKASAAKKKTTKTGASPSAAPKPSKGPPAKKSAGTTKASPAKKTSRSATGASAAKKIAKAPTARKTSRTIVATKTTKSAASTSKKAATAAWSSPAYPFALPMSRDSLTQALEDLAPLRAVKAAYLCFFMLPLEERIGEWRFAGTATNLADALENLGSYLIAMHFEIEGSPREQLASLLEGGVLEIGTPENVWGDHPGATFQDEWDEALPENHVITFAKGGAPYDEIGFAILEVASLGSFAGREPDTRRPEEWPEEG